MARITFPFSRGEITSIGLQALSSLHASREDWLTISIQVNEGSILLTVQCLAIGTEWMITYDYCGFVMNDGISGGFKGAAQQARPPLPPPQKKNDRLFFSMHILY